MAQKIKTLWANFTKSPEQKYLEQAVDLVDLEQRIKNKTQTINFETNRIDNRISDLQTKIDLIQSKKRNDFINKKYSQVLDFLLLKINPVIL